MQIFVRLTQIIVAIWWLTTVIATAFMNYNGTSIPASNIIWAIACFFIPPLCIIFTFISGTWIFGIIVLALFLILLYLDPTKETTQEETEDDRKAKLIYFVSKAVYNEGATPYAATLIPRVTYHFSDPLYQGEGTLLLYPNKEALYISPARNKLKFTRADITSTTENLYGDNDFYLIIGTEHIAISKEHNLTYLKEWLAS